MIRAIGVCGAVLAMNLASAAGPVEAAELKVGAAAVELEADDSMVNAGSILPRFAKGQEGKLRAVAVVLQRSPSERLAFRDADGQLVAMLFNHSTHTIGSLAPRVRSPAFYGMAAQAIEAERGGVVAFLQGASGSTHRLEVAPAEAKERIEKAVLDALSRARPRQVTRLASLKRPFEFTIRTFDEEAEDRAVSEYCTKNLRRDPGPTIEVFRKMRRELAPLQGQKRTTWIQAMAVGDVAVVGVPAEFFTKLGIDIKRRSPFENTVVAELANDWIGYLPDRKAHRLGGYQVWTGLHSYAAPGTGERMADEVVRMLEELAR